MLMKMFRVLPVSISKDSLARGYHGGDWIKFTRDLSVLLLTAGCES